jgi:hypothetical protein
MRRFLTAVGTCCVLSVALAWAADKELTYLDLQPYANQKLKDNFHSGAEGNNLAELSEGEQTLEGVKFKIGESLIQLGSKVLENPPEKVEGIKVDKALAKLHILHATAYGRGQEGDELYVADDTVIGKYIVNYDDKSTETIEIAYGKDVRDWWYGEGDKEVSRGKVAWKGDNERAKSLNAKIRLYLTTWTNPKPEKKVASIDYISTKETAAAPFCVAMTIEGK